MIDLSNEQLFHVAGGSQAELEPTKNGIPMLVHTLIRLEDGTIECRFMEILVDVPRINPLFWEANWIPTV